jgi:hypothetical protein
MMNSVTDLTSFRIYSNVVLKVNIIGILQFRYDGNVVINNRYVKIQGNRP